MKQNGEKKLNSTLTTWSENNIMRWLHSKEITYEEIYNGDTK